MADIYDFFWLQTEQNPKNKPMKGSHFLFQLWVSPQWKRAYGYRVADPEWGVLGHVKKAIVVILHMKNVELTEV